MKKGDLVYNNSMGPDMIFLVVREWGPHEFLIQLVYTLGDDDDDDYVVGDQAESHRSRLTPVPELLIVALVANGELCLP